MAESLRNVYKRSELARTIRDGVKDLTLEQITNALRRNNLSTRGLTGELEERLIRFEIREQVPDVTVRWDDALDLADAVNYNQEGPSGTQSSENEEVTIRERQHESQNGVETVEADVEIHAPPRAHRHSQVTHRVMNSLVPHTTQPTGVIRNARLFVREEIHTLHRQEGLGN